MHLKSLNLKGFKSFADRSVLGFEPGITAIVGPNGSGKSNISDAVLWVLGERNAKNLRGQAMEDVVFAGSSARKPVGIAEVDLVLDNSDGTLPIEFNEVAITRRMYRSGESEYLINGATARRMDVLDILHDTGLGTGTHSIISQGSLDSILQSKPEDRRSLIEEAAGVLKHKQRKQKSERKLAQMDNHLARVKDVAAEVERQLKPLERKAKRAQAYQGLAAELAELNLSIAVDDLRQLQKKWKSATQNEELLSAQLEEMKVKITEAEHKVQQLQEEIQQRSENAGEIARMHRRAQSVIERLDSTSLLLHEKQRNSLSLEESLLLSIEGNRVKRVQAEVACRQAEEQLEQTQKERLAAEEIVQKLETEQKELLEKRNTLEKELNECTRGERECTQEIEKTRLALAENQELLSNSRAHEKLISGHSKELELQIEHAKADLEKNAAFALEQNTKLEDTRKREQEAREAVSTSFTAREAARINLEEIQNNLALLSAEIKGLEELERANEAASPSLEWVMENKDSLESTMSLLSHTLTVPEHYDQLVEWLLGGDIRSILVSDNSVAEKIAQSLEDRDDSGEVVIVPCKEVAKSISEKKWPKEIAGNPALISFIDCPDAYQATLYALLGDVYICDSRKTALAAHESDKAGARFVTLDGFMVWANSKISIFSSDESDEGILARHRHLEQLRKQHKAVTDEFEKVTEQKLQADKDLQESQGVSLQLAQELAQLQGSQSAAQQEETRSQEKLASLNREYEDLQKQKSEAQLVLADAQPASVELEAKVTEFQNKLQELKDKISAIQQDMSPLVEQNKTIDEGLSTARLQVATFNERESYARRMLEGNKGDIQGLERDSKESKENLVRKRIARGRIEPLLHLLESLEKSAKRWTIDLEEATNAAQSSSSGLHGAMTEARNAARKNQDEYDALNNKLSEARVEKGRLEIQVEAAINVIVQDCKTPLESALEQPELENREEIEDSVFKLRRRIANMGTINPDAAVEYEELKTRYDYMASQLEDMMSARHALSKIVRVIDARMKDDFINTFEKVNENFKEIFAVLFPGGSAELLLVDPEDPENTGVEVTAQPRGKRITKMMLMSGGEKSLTALALLFAVYRIRATPFYILDEVEAALDDTNLRRLCAYLNSLREGTQLILITHQRRTMEMADVLYGISMQADGVTRVVSQKLDRALQYAEG